MKPHAISILVLAASASLPGMLCAADWPQWRGPERTGHAPAGAPVPAALSAELKRVWRIPIGEGFASPVVAGGTVFYLDNQAGNEVVHAVSAADGKEIWNKTLFASHRDNFGIGPRCTPVADGGRLYVQSCKGEFQCLNAADGKLIWRKNFVDDFGAVFIGEIGKAAGGSRHGNAGSPVVDGERIVVQAGSAKGACLVCLDKATGAEIWRAESDQSAYAPPMIATLGGVKQVLSFTAEGLIGVDAGTGKLIWRVPLKTAFGRHVTTPVVVDDTVLVASHEVGLVATRVSKDADGPKAAEAWVNKEMRINFASPVAVGAHLYALGPAKNIVCLEAASGKVAWDKRGLILTEPTKAHASFLVLGKNVLVLTDKGELILFVADPAEYREISRVQACGFNWCNPAYVDGKLYLRDAKELYCLELLR